MLKPLNDNIILKEIKKEEKTESGLLLTRQEDENSKTMMAEVIEVPEEFEELKKSDKVILNKEYIEKVNYDNEEYIIADLYSILAKIEK